MQFRLDAVIASTEWAAAAQYRLVKSVFYDVSGTTIKVLAIVAKSEADSWPAQFGAPLSEAKDDLSHYLREAETQEIIITRHGKPAGVLIGFESEEDCFDYRLAHDPRFLRRIEQQRCALDTESGWRTSKQIAASGRLYRSLPATVGQGTGQDSARSRTKS